MTSSHYSNRPAALISGGAIRLGKAIALGLAEAGYDIAIHYRNSTTEAVQTVAEIEALGVDAASFSLDLNNAQAIPDLIAQVHRRFPNLNVLINSASGYTQRPIAKTTPAIFDDQLGVNLRAPFFLTQAFAAQVKQGAVINILDNKIGFNQYQYAAYLLAKKGLAAFTIMAAMEFAPRIRVNGVAPGVVLPATVRSADYIEWRRQGIPLQKTGQPDHVLQAILSLLNNDFMTGQIITVDGGENSAHLGQNAAAYPAGSDQ